jgi:hypothetical protein
VFPLAERPALFPGATVLGNTAGPVVDCGELPAGGRVYIDRLEAGEIARHFGFAKPEEVEKLRQLVATRDERIAELELKLVTIREQVAEVAA